MTGTELLSRIPKEDWDATPASVQHLLLSLLPLATEAGELRDRLQELEQRSRTHGSDRQPENIATLERYHTLVDKLFLSGLSDDEQAEMERLGAEIDRENAPFYV